MSSQLNRREPAAGITILIPTFNRAEPLRETLSALTALDYSGVDCEIVVIDNNSTDATAAVVKSFQGRMPLVYLHETRQGKNPALNKALRECTLKDIVVFTDDDVTPDPYWLQQIAQVCARWPEIAVFGGRIEVQWPVDRPEWAEGDWILAFGYSRHDLGDREVAYEGLECPLGPNFWVRKDVFATVPWFDEEMGPRPTNRMMAGETAFLLNLRSRGFIALYTPLASVKHRVTARECQLTSLRRRAYRLGRAQARLHGWSWQETYRKSKVLWATTIAADYVYSSGRLMWGFVQPDPRSNCYQTVDAMVRIGRLNETLSLLWGKP